MDSTDTTGSLRNDLLQLIPSGVGIFDVTGDTVRTEYVNDGYYQMLGTTRAQRGAYTGENTLSAVHPDDASSLIAEAHASIRERRLFSCRFRVLDGARAWRWVAIRANHISLSDDVERFYASYYDIDELMRIQEMLRENGQQAEQALENEQLRMKSLQSGILAASCFNVTADNNVELNNDENLSYRDIVDNKLFDFALKCEPGVVHQAPETLRVLLSAAEQIPDAAQRCMFIQHCSHAGMLKHYEEGNRDDTIEYRRWTGKGLIWVSTRLVLLPDPATGELLAFLYTTDINDRVIYRKITGQIIERNYETVAYYDFNTDKLFVRSMTSASSITFDELPYPDILEAAIAQFVIPADQERVRQGFSVERIVAELESKPLYTLFYTSTMHDNKLPSRPLKQMKCDFFYLDESHDIVVFLQADATEIYEQERENHERMATALQAAETANRSKTEFVSRISHDIRTPISIISNITDFALDDIGDEAKLRDDLEKIKSADTFLLSLINDVLDISKIDSGKIQLNPTPYTYEEYSRNVQNILEPMCAEKGLTCSIVRSHVTGTIVADVVRLNQITLNVLSNAVKYTPAGGSVTYTSISEDLPDDKIRFGFEIRDTGIGMSKEFQKQMFETFSQEYDNPLRPSGLSGTGLGLAIVKRMVDLMDGTLEVESDIGKGTMIRCVIVFPDATRDPRYANIVKDADAQQTDRSPLSGKLLLAEDNAINTEIAVRIIESFGLTVDCVENGKRAVDAFAASAPDEYRAILMDIQMPIMNGYDATRAIRALDRPDARSIPIIAMTADAFSDAAQRGREAGMDEYLIKPMDPVKLRATLEKTSAPRSES